MAFLNIKRAHRAPIDLDAIRRDHPLPEVVGAVVKLERAGNEFKACCPFHSDRTPSFTIFDGGKRYHCFGCGASGDVLDFVQQSHGVGLREAADMLAGGNLPSVHVAPVPLDDGPDRSEEARAIWASATPIKGTLAEDYLRNRGLHLPLPDCLRFASLRYGGSGPEYPVMVAAVASADDRLIGIQRTYLAPDGTGKAAVPKSKLSLGRISGGAVRLGPCARSIFVCEGIEDGLTLVQELGRSTWASAGAGNLHKMIFPLGVEAVAIGGDNDSTGQSEARKAAEAFARRGIEARCFFPLPGFKDFNDELKGVRI